MCYNVLQKKWLEWSKGYIVPIEGTTLRGVKVYAAITGKDLTEPAKQQDVIWHFLFRVCGKSTEPTFKAEQIQLAVVINYKDYACIKFRKEKLNGSTTSMYAPTMVCKYNLVLFMYYSLSIDHW